MLGRDVIHEQGPQPGQGHAVPLFYAYCACGLCGPMRRNIEAARLDEEAHAEVCRDREQ